MPQQGLDPSCSTLFAATLQQVMAPAMQEPCMTWQTHPAAPSAAVEPHSYQHLHDIPNEYVSEPQHPVPNQPDHRLRFALLLRLLLLLLLPWASLSSALSYTTLNRNSRSSKPCRTATSCGGKASRSWFLLVRMFGAFTPLPLLLLLLLPFLLLLLPPPRKLPRPPKRLLRGLLLAVGAGVRPARS
jgi:hypothetical protein